MQFYAYISTGAKSAMFTLWRGRRSGDARLDAFSRDHYVCNLAAGAVTDEDYDAKRELALTKALDFCQRMGDRLGTEMTFEGFEDEPRNARKGKLSVQDTRSLNTIEAGKFPFGKHAGMAFADAPDGYVLWWADQPATNKPVIEALRAACMGAAMERDLIAKREEKRAERKAEDMKSNAVGDVGQRLVLLGEIVSSFFKDRGYGDGYWITKIRTNNGDLIVNFGREIGPRGKQMKFKATVKRHNEYQGVVTTTVNRIAEV